MYKRVVLVQNPSLKFASSNEYTVGARKNALPHLCKSTVKYTPRFSIECFINIDLTFMRKGPQKDLLDRSVENKLLDA